MVAITPSFISALTTSPARAAMRLASSCTVMVLRQHDLAHYFHLVGAQQLQFRLAPLAFALATHRGQAADALILALDGGLHVDLGRRADDLQALLGRGHRRACAAAARRRGGGSAAPRHRPRPGGRGLRRSVSGGPDGARPAAARRAAPRRAARPRRAAPWRSRPSAACGPLASAASRAASSALRRASSSAARRASSSRRRASSAADRIEIFSCSRRSASRLADFALLLDQRTLASRQLGRGQGPPAARVRRAARGGRPCCGAGAPAGAAAERRRGGRRPGHRAAGMRGALLAHLHLHHLRSPVAEALPHGAGIHGPAQLHPASWPQRQPPLARVLIVAFAHVYPPVPVPSCSTGQPFVPPAIPDAILADAARRPGRRSTRAIALGQVARRHRDMHHMVTAEHRPKRLRRTVDHDRHTRSHPPEIAPAPPRLHPTPARPARRGRRAAIARLLKSADCLSGATGEAQEFGDPPRKRRLHHRRRVRRHRNRPACSPGKCRPRRRAVSNTSARALNHIPRPGSRSARSGTISAVRPDDEADHPLLGSRSRVTMQRRSGPLSALVLGIVSGVSVASVVVRLLGFAALALRLEPMRARRHDHFVGGRLVHLLGADDLHQFVDARSARSSSVFTPFSPSATSIAGVSASIAATSSLTPSCDALLVQLGVAPGQEGFGAADQFGGDVLVEAFDRGELPRSGVNASSSTVVKPSVTSRPAIMSSTSSASTNRPVRRRNSSWRRSLSSASVRMSMSQRVSC